jgi:hypothetical protein
LRKALLALPELQSHGGEEQATRFLEIAENYEILDQIGYFTGDNHGSNDKMCRFIASGLRKQGIINWDPKHHRVRCQGHVINLAVQAFLFSKDKEAIEEAIRQAEQDENLDIDDTLAERLKKAKTTGWRQIGALGKLHNLAVHIRSSEQRYNWFYELAGVALGLDNDTRWNSWYLMLLTALKPKVRNALLQYIDKYYDEVKNDYLSPEEWHTLEETSQFLQPFYRATLETEGDCATIDRTLYTMDILIKHFSRSKVRSTYFQFYCTRLTKSG